MSTIASSLVKTLSGAFSIVMPAPTPQDQVIFKCNQVFLECLNFIIEIDNCKEKAFTPDACSPRIFFSNKETQRQEWEHFHQDYIKFVESEEAKKVNDLYQNYCELLAKRITSHGRCAELKAEAGLPEDVRKCIIEE